MRKVQSDMQDHAQGIANPHRGPLPFSERARVWVGGGKKIISVESNRRRKPVERELTLMMVASVISATASIALLIQERAFDRSTKLDR